MNRIKNSERTSSQSGRKPSRSVCVHRKQKIESKKKSRRPSPTSTSELWQYREEANRSFIGKAQRCLDTRSGSRPEDHAVLLALVGDQNRLSDPIMSNLGLRKRMAELLVARCIAKRKEAPSSDFALGTVLNAPWDTSLETPEIDVYRIQTETRSALSAMFTNWLALIELQAFANVQHDVGAYLIGVHVHFIGYGSDARDRAEANLRQTARRFTSRFAGADSLKLKWIGATDLDLARAVSYPWKPPNRSKTLYVNANTGRCNLHESEANDRYVRYLRMVQILSMLRVDRVTYGAGQGATMRTDALREAKSWLRTGEYDRVPPIHSSAVPNYWIDLWERLKKPRFKQPIIKYKKY